MGAPLVQGAATVVGALIALVAVLAVQVRTAAAARTAQRLDVQRDALAAFLAGAELVLDDVRELGSAHDDRDTARTDLVTPRYFDHWSRFAEAYARVQMHGPEEVREAARGVRTAVGDFCDGQADYARSTSSRTSQASRKEQEAAWYALEDRAKAEVRNFRERAIAVTTPSGPAPRLS